MRAHLAFVLPPAILLGSALLASVFLIPTERELAWIHYKAKNYGVARDRFSALVDRGDLSVAVVKPLSELHLQYGDVDRAITLLERFVARSPEDVQAVRRLGTYYQYAQRPRDYRKILERLATIDPDPTILRKLAQIENAEGRYQAQIDALLRLTTAFPGEPRDFLDLAYLQAREGHPKDASATLARLESLHPNIFEDEVLELALNLLLDTDEPERALAVASRALRRKPDPSALARYASLFAFKSGPEHGLRLLGAFETIASDEPAVLAEHARLLALAGELDRAWERLLPLRARGPLPPEVVPVFLELALGRGAVREAFAALTSTDVGTLPEWLLVALADAAATLPSEPFAGELLPRLRPGLLDQTPLVAAGLEAAAGHLGLARDWARRIDEDGLSVDERLRLAWLYQRLDEPQNALRILVALDDAGHLGNEETRDLASLYIRLGRAGEAIARFEGRPESREAWALVAASAGRAGAATRWLAGSPPESPGDALLTDLFSIAEQEGESELALEAARRLYARRPRSDQRRLQLARALVRSSLPLEALVHLRELAPRSEEADEIYGRALFAAFGKGFAVRDELSRHLRAKLARSSPSDEALGRRIDELLAIRDFEPAFEALAGLAANDPDRWAVLYAETAVEAGRSESLPPFLRSVLSRKALSSATRESLTYLLLKHGGEEAALDDLRRLADTVGGHWVYTYETALAHLDPEGQTGAIERLWLERAARTDLSPDERRGAAYRLIDLGRKQEAAGVFFELAKDAPPESADVSELLFLSGGEAVPWLVARARNATGPDRARWMRHLTSVGAPEQAAGLLAPAGLTALSPPERKAYLEALQQARSPLLEDAIDEAIDLEPDPDWLRFLGRIAIEASALGVADRVYEELEKKVPGDPDALAKLGLVAFLRSDYARAESFLRRFHETGRSNWESLYTYAEVLLRKGQPTRARVYFERALEDIASRRSQDFQSRATRAQILHRLDRPREAFESFRALVAEQPENAHVHADYVAALLERNDYTAAEKALNQAVATQGEGRLRLALLRANLEVRTGRAKAALERLTRLAASRPESPIVVAALAEARAASGQWTAALDALDRALALDPRNEDIRKARASLWREHAPRAGGELRERSAGAGELQRVMIFAARARFRRRYELGWSFRQAQARTSFWGTRSGTRSHGEVALRYDDARGRWYRASLHAVQGGPGGSFELGTAGPRRATRVALQYRLPFWSLFSGVIDDARRDRVLIEHQRGLSPRLTMRLAGALNRYGVLGLRDVSRSFSLDGDITYRARLKSPAVSAQYLFDVERLNRTSPIFDLVSREVHAPGVLLSAGVGKHLRTDGVLGWAWDRLGGRAPFFGLHLFYDLPPHVRARTFVERRLYRLDTARAEQAWGFELHWSF